MTTLLTLELRAESDVVAARQRARQIARLLGFDEQDQTRLATAVSEIARNAFHYASGGRIEFGANLHGPQPAFQIIVRDQGPGIADLPAILDGRYHSQTGLGVGLSGARRLMDFFDVQTEPGRGTTVTLTKRLPRSRAGESPPTLAHIADELARQAPHNPLEEVQIQNRELLRALEHVNRELQETNQGVVALYAELDEKAEALQRASEHKTRFLSHMTHEFRTPLGSIIGLARLLEARVDGDLTPEQEKQVALVRESAESLLVLVNDLLDLAKIEAGRISVRTALFAVSDLFGTLRGMLRPLTAGAPAVTLVFEDPPPDLPLLGTDEGKVAQILRNFIANALKFAERGEVRVSATCDGSSGAVVFTVRDQGVGIAPGDLERVWEEFARVENGDASTVRKPGTGLGLPLSRRLAELLGGRVFVESAVGEGTTFGVVLPVRYNGPPDALLDAAVRAPR